MGDDVKIDKAQFHTRLSSLITQWKADKRSGSNVFGDVGSILLVMGKSDETAGFHKINGAQFWFLGYEFPTTLHLITMECMYIITTKKKAQYLEALKDGKTAVEIMVRGKDAQENAKQFEKCLEVIRNVGKKVGVLKEPSSQAQGPFIQEWKTAFADISKEVEEVDISPAISAAMAVKDEAELRAINNSAKASAAVMQDFCTDHLTGVLERGEKVTHRAVSDKIADTLEDDQFWGNRKMPPNFDSMQLDWNQTPIVQSGGNFDVTLTSDPDKNTLHAGVVLCALGFRYQTYSSLVARTLMIDPNKAQTAAYKLLLSVHEAVLKEMRDGAIAKDVYRKALSIVKSKQPDFEKHFVKNVGAAIGIEAKDTGFMLDGKCERTLRDGMTFTVTTGFSDLENREAQGRKKDATYALLLTDTVRVRSNEDAFVFTKHAAADIDACQYYFPDDEPVQKKEKPKAKKDSKVGAVASSNITKTRLRGQGAATQNEEKEAARREHQRELHVKKQSEGAKKYGEGHGNLNGTEEKKFKRFESYKRDAQLPSRVRDLMILIDQKNSSIILPIMGRPVPFHINTLKNATTSTEGDFCFLRINFLSPGQGVGRKDDQPFEDPSAQFIRSLTFRSKDKDRMEEVKERVTEMKKEAVRKDNEKKEMEDVVEQDKLAEIRNRRPHRLDNIFMRPAMESKRIGGAVEIHANGLRYLHMGSQRIDILFSNVKHLFFQPSVGELVVIIHVHLINPIIIGKKKTKDVQFYREATEMQFDETGNRKRKHRYGDEEEFEAEQEEKRRRAQLDKEFKNFAEKIADAAKEEGISVDMPFRDLGFNGVPARSSVTIQPTTDCLVQLTEPPFTVVTLTDIEVVHLERVQFGLKNFDMVIVFKDFTRPPAHINTIPVEALDGVKDWLDSVDIPFSEGPLNLNWATIMKTVIADPHMFFKDGGWSFLSNESDSEDEGEEEEESAFEESDAPSDESSEDDESDFDDDASAEASEEEVSDDEEGEDWDEMEKKAAKKDREGALDDGETKKKSKKR